MKMIVAVLIGMLLSTGVFAGSFPEDFQEARKLYHTGKSAEAEAAFVALAGRNVSKRATDEALAQAVNCALAQKKYDKAGEYAAKIGVPALNKLCQIQILRSQSRWDDLLALCKGEDIESWPDALVFDALLWRGRAWAAKRDCANAEMDFLASVRFTVVPDNKALAYHALGDLYREVAKDDEKAMQSYGEIVKLADALPTRRLAPAVMGRARILAAQGKGAQALAELDRLDADRIKEPYWQCSIQTCYGEVLERMGRNADALARYKAAVSCENAPEALLSAARKKMEALTKTPQERGKP